MTNLYTVLGVRPGANQLEIRDAYRTAMRAAHPDRATGEADRARRTARSAEINGAYEILGDPERRTAYDLEQLAAPPTGRGTAPVTPTARPGAPQRPAAPVRGSGGSSARLRLSWTDLSAFPGAFLGYTVLPVIAPGTTSLAGAAWGALIAIVAARLATGDGQLDRFVERLRRR
jgi:curved DNA-binding protein CbpA